MGMVFMLREYMNGGVFQTQAAPLYPILPKVPLVMVSREVYKCMLGQPATSMINGWTKPQVLNHKRACYIHFCVSGRHFFLLATVANGY